MQGMFYEIMINIKKNRIFFGAFLFCFTTKMDILFQRLQILLKKQIESNNIYVHAQGNVNYKLNKLI